MNLADYILEHGEDCRLEQRMDYYESKGICPRCNRKYRVCECEEGEEA